MSAGYARAAILPRYADVWEALYGFRLTSPQDMSPAGYELAEHEGRVFSPRFPPTSLFRLTVSGIAGTNRRLV